MGKKWTRTLVVTHINSTLPIVFFDTRPPVLCSLPISWSMPCALCRIPMSTDSLVVWFIISCISVMFRVSLVLYFTVGVHECVLHGESTRIKWTTIALHNNGKAVRTFILNGENKNTHKINTTRNRYLMFHLYSSTSCGHTSMLCNFLSSCLVHLPDTRPKSQHAHYTHQQTYNLVPKNTTGICSFERRTPYALAPASDRNHSPWTTQCGRYFRQVILCRHPVLPAASR